MSRTIITPPAPRRPSVLCGPLPCAGLLLPSQNGRAVGVPTAPAENGRGGGPPFSQARVVLEHTVWGSLLGSTRKAHGGRASFNLSLSSLSPRRPSALCGPLLCAGLLLPSQNGRAVGVPTAPAENGRGGGLPFSQARVVPEHTVWGSLLGSTRKAHGGRASFNLSLSLSLSLLLKFVIDLLPRCQFTFTA